MWCKKSLKETTNNLDDGIKKVGKEVKSAIKKKLDDVDEFMKTPEFQKIVDDAWKRYKGKLSKEKWTEKYKTLYKNREKGKITEKTFKELMGGNKPTKSITTSDGKRYFDNVLENTAREVKSGPITLSNSKQQILKDIEILNQNLTNNQISKIEWHCFDEVNEIEINKFIQDNLRQELKNTEVFKIIKY
ncbi:hypothetical protein EDL99_09025 [Ornithobacterium rhinotracheale]|uniref:hypothetical protein n=1 Tax=Ornithobacterium rhinotracheale TaxID=28251 RepID=UPI00129C6087|nr:hypothetical protein [Ornithobacterium rhinotracheale]MRJ09000.1 hypothetical protein [Ornithobacterium rhinotracheale]UOH77194.1 hypothetical protein MT996_08220 [Ornithobacterium rhinotracheale]